MKNASTRIGYLTSSSPSDRKAWSGTLHYIHKALSAEFEHLIPLGPLHTNGFTLFGKVCSKLADKVTGKKINYLHNHLRSKILARKISRKLHSTACDVLFAPAGAAEIAHLKTSIPIGYLSDTSFGQIINYYDRYTNLTARAIASGNDLERRAIKNAAGLIYASDWAASYVKSHYAVENKEVHVIPFGANIDIEPSRNEVLPKNNPSTWNLLFLGVFWERKGGDVALQTVDLLSHRGYNVKLTVVGCTPPVTHPKMEVIPFLRKSIPEDYKRFTTLLKESQLLFLPTQAEAYGVVFCEAAAYGLPSITRATGGTTTAVLDGQNGYALQNPAGPSDFADAIAKLIDNADEYRRLCESSRARYEDTLNWRSWGKNCRSILEKIATASISTA